jgi:hypothetical protein
MAAQRWTILKLVLVVSCLISASWTTSAIAATGSTDTLGIRQLMDKYPPGDGPRFYLADDTKSESASPSPPATRSESNLNLDVKESVTWLDDFLTEQILFTEAAMRQWRARLLDLPSDEAQQWLEQTRRLRLRLSSDSWLTTQRWLRDFLAVQAIYSPAEIAAFRQRMCELDAGQMSKVVDHFQRLHQSRARTQEAVIRLRQQMPRVRTTSPSTAGFSRTSAAASFTPGSVPSNVMAGSRGTPRPPRYIQRPRLAQRIANVYLYRSIFDDNYLYFILP